MSDPRPRILLVDDDPAILRAYKKALGVRGCDVDTAANGKLGLAQMDTDGVRRHRERRLDA